ncbi:hypothetical protein EXIGLDRAFT_831756 [Exidia glandulosa HHB12029]|uniref:CinA C-terminal domain-containing protein n=1 Tax=Exidia glandulosa HHB12029 TaxID=1314781 RepID=A0A165MA15_EXIGL|nr:hypothetical protein EXIGLDRAFT_831756 [Exidia glandulosa HHB12029]
MPSVVTQVLNGLERLSLPIVTAESCTAGALASALTSKPAAPSLCLGGITSYSPLFKHAILDVPASIISADGPGEVSSECARAMAEGVLKRSGLLEVDAEREFKRGVLRERAQGIGISTTGYLDKLPDGQPRSKAGEVWIGCHWIYNGTCGTRVEKLNVANVRGRPPPEAANVDQSDADRNERKETVVARALDMLVEIVEELERRGHAESGEHQDSKQEVEAAEKQVNVVQDAEARAGQGDGLATKSSSMGTGIKRKSSELDDASTGRASKRHDS